MQLNKREKLLLAAGIMIIFLLAFYQYFLKPIQVYRNNLARNIVNLEKQFQQISLLGQELKELNKGDLNRSVPLNKRINSILHQTKLKGKSNILEEKRPGDEERLVVKLENVNLSEFQIFIFSLENSKPVILIENIDVSYSFTSEKYLRISLSLASY